jgi:hypothetical protein
VQCLLIADLQLLSCSKVFARIPSITRKPSTAQYGSRSRKMHPNIVFNLLISRACAKVCAQLRAAGAYCEVLP